MAEEVGPAPEEEEEEDNVKAQEGEPRLGDIIGDGLGDGELQ